MATRRPPRQEFHRCLLRISAELALIRSRGGPESLAAHGNLWCSAPIPRPSRHHSSRRTWAAALWAHNHRCEQPSRRQQCPRPMRRPSGARKTRKAGRRRVQPQQQLHRRRSRRSHNASRHGWLTWTPHPVRHHLHRVHLPPTCMSQPRSRRMRAASHGRRCRSGGSDPSWRRPPSLRAARCRWRRKGMRRSARSLPSANRKAAARGAWPLSRLSRPPAGFSARPIQFERDHRRLLTARLLIHLRAIAAPVAQQARAPGHPGATSCSPRGTRWECSLRDGEH